MLTLAPVTSLSQLRLRTWAFSTHQLATSWLMLEGGSLSILARLERPAIYFKGFLFWCSALMLFCCMTVCRPLTAWTNDRTHLCIQSIFRLPWERSIPRVKNKKKKKKNVRCQFPYVGLFLAIYVRSVERGSCPTFNCYTIGGPTSCVLRSLATIFLQPMLVYTSNISLKISTFGSRDIVDYVAVRPPIYGVLTCCQL